MSVQYCYILIIFVVVMLVSYVQGSKELWELSGRVLYSRPRGRGFEPHRRHCVVSLSKTH